MIKLIKHGIHLLQNRFRDVGLPVKRSSKWEGVERAFKAEHPSCAACGAVNGRLQVHHIAPFHLHPELELDEANLIVLCMNENECHLKIGHCNNWRTYNSNVVEDAANALAHPEQFEAICQEAKMHALKN